MDGHRDALRRDLEHIERTVRVDIPVQLDEDQLREQFRDLIRRLGEL